MSSADVTVVVPLLDEAARMPILCRHLNSLRCPVIAVDGGSSDGTYPALRRAAAANVRVVRSDKGRALQMNYGASLAQSPYLLFLHADTLLPPGGIGLAREALGGGAWTWGRFDVAFDTGSPLMSTIAWFMNQRSALTGICTGDQAMFATADAFESAGRFPEIPLMEDIELSSRLLRSSRPARILTPVVTASRRWRRNGVLRTVLTMWRLRFLYLLGVPPAALAERYGNAR